MVDELLAARGLIVSHEAVQQGALKFGQGFAPQLGEAESSRPDPSFPGVG